MITLYGLRNCDTCRKARVWLEGQALAYRFHDFRADGLDPALLRAWIDAVGWEALLNRRGTTWRSLSEADRAELDSAKALSLMLEHPALIKRPVLDHCGKLLVGFTPALYLRSVEEP